MEGTLRIVVILLTIVACSTPKAEEEPYALPGLDHGLIQSPINIITDSLTEGHHQIKANFDSSHIEIVHLEHSVRINYDSGSTVVFDGRVYEFQQFHFHTPAEHLIDGITYPMEVHLVHTQKGDTSNIAHYFVLAVLFKMGDQDENIQEFIDLVPDEIGGIGYHRTKFYNIKFIFGINFKDYYHYTGSLTTPPFSETVHWAVSKHILEASPAQIAKLNQMEGNNARHIQSVNGRKIELIHQ